MNKEVNINRWVFLFAAALAVCFLGVTGCASARSGADDVASRIKDAVIQADRDQFRQFFADNSDLSEDDFAYYFGLEEPSLLRKFLVNPGVSSKSFDGVNDEGRKVITVVYYHSGSAEEPDNLDWNKIGNGWLKEYAAVDLVLINGKWYFDKTPFFFFRHAPWAGDYG